MDTSFSKIKTTSTIKLTCLSGGQGDPGDDDYYPIPCYLLEIDQFKCLLDCGWDAKLSSHIVEEIEKHFPSVNAILLSHPDPTHLGALPYLVKKHGLKCPVYCTRPISLMGQMFMTDLLLSKLYNQEFNLFSQEDIKTTFESDKITHLNYHQTFPLEGKGQGLSITPLPAGHMIGGTIWKIVKDDEEDIIYAVDYNHGKERHLNGCALNTITHPSLFITDAYNARSAHIKKNERDNKFVDSIASTLQSGGNVLIACDTAGRVLEIANLLDFRWHYTREPRLSTYSLALLNNVAVKMIDITMSTLEWMGDSILKEFDKSRGNPFKFKHLVLKHAVKDLSDLPQPIVVLATPPDLDCGFAKDLFVLWSTDPKNSIIFTQRPSPNTLGYEVLHRSTNLMNIEIWHRIELQGEELEEYKKKEEEKKHLALIESQKALAIHDSDSDEETTNNILDKSNASIVAQQASKYDLMMNENRQESSMFFKQIKKANPIMFPAPVDLDIKFDDYGEIINPDDYTLLHKMQPTNKLMGGYGDDKENQTIKSIEEPTEEEMKPQAPPTKCVSIVIPLKIEANIEYFDYEGRSDGQSVKNLISQIKPRRLVLIKGSESATECMKPYCRVYVSDSENHEVTSQSSGDTEDAKHGLFYPKNHESVVADTRHSIYHVVLGDSLMANSLDFSEVEEGVELAWIDANFYLPEMVGIKDESEPLPLLEQLEAEKLPLHEELYINELKLQDFREVLRNNRVQAEISGGILFCNDKVTVRKRQGGKVHVEGPLCDDYVKVRSLLYKQLVIL